MDAHTMYLDNLGGCNDDGFVDVDLESEGWRNTVKKNKNDRYDTIVHVPVHDLRALLFWASVGVKNSYSGSYREACETPDDEGIIRSYARHIKFLISGKIAFKEPK